MFKFITSQSLLTQSMAALAAAFLAGMTVFFSSVAPPAYAMSRAGGLVSEPVAMAEHLALVIPEAPCSDRSWPDYDQGCLRRSSGDLRQVRVINLDARGLQARGD